MTDINEKELKSIMDAEHLYGLIHTIEQAIYLKFPSIENLTVEQSPYHKDIVSLSFSGGATREEVELFLNEFRK